MTGNGGKDRTSMNRERPEEVSNMVSKTVKTEGDIELKPSLFCATSDLITGNKSRQHLTETEKEARRFRRVIANRESARQTIRRRQSMFEELTRKAIDLGLENENLKREKELGMKERDSLKSTNDCLKAEMAKMMTAEAEEIKEKSNSNHPQRSTPLSTTNLSFPYNQASMVPFHWPPTIQPSDASIQHSTSENGIATLVPMTQMWMPNSFMDQGNSVMIANPGTLLYVLPSSCFLPYHASVSAFHPQLSEQNDEQNDNSMDPQCNASSSKRVVQGSSNQSSLPLQVKTEASNSTGSTTMDDRLEDGFGYPSDGGGGGEGMYCTNMVHRPTPLSCVRPVASVGPFTSLLHDDTSNVEAIALAASLTEEGTSEENQEPVVYLTKKPAGAIAAAEARKRRKELIKLKNLQMHHF